MSQITEQRQLINYSRIFTLKWHLSLLKTLQVVQKDKRHHSQVYQIISRIYTRNLEICHLVNLKKNT
jgi:hypothetical protein